jgi:hypothetical protein
MKRRIPESRSLIFISLSRAAEKNLIMCWTASETVELVYTLKRIIAAFFHTAELIIISQQVTNVLIFNKLKSKHDFIKES